MNENKLWQPILDTSTPETIDSENFFGKMGRQGNLIPSWEQLKEKQREHTERLMIIIIGRFRSSQTLISVRFFVH